MQAAPTTIGPRRSITNSSSGTSVIGPASWCSGVGSKPGKSSRTRSTSASSFSRSYGRTLEAFQNVIGLIVAQPSLKPRGSGMP